MALVLCTGSDAVAMDTRRVLLEQAGHSVVLASGEPELVAACEEHEFEVAVVGQSLNPNEKRRILQLVRWHCPKARVLELFETGTSSALPGADDWLMMPADPPTGLADRVSRLASKRAKSRRAR